MTGSADNTGLEQALAAQHVGLLSHEEAIKQLQQQQALMVIEHGEMCECLRKMDSSMCNLADSIAKAQFSAPSQTSLNISQTLPTVPQMFPREAKVQLPPRFNGESGKCRGFLAQCQIVYRAQPSRFQSEDSRVALILSLLEGPALDWAVPLIRAQAPVLNDSQSLMNEMEMVFDHELYDKEVAMKLTRMRQGTSSVAEFSITFRTLAGATGWPEGPLITLFTNALSDQVKDALAAVGSPDTFDTLVTSAIRIDNRIRERERERRHRHTRVPLEEGLPFPPRSSVVSSSEPMQVDSTSVRDSGEGGSREDWCRYCRRKGHTKVECPKLKGNDQSRWRAERH